MAKRTEKDKTVPLLPTKVPQIKKTKISFGLFSLSIFYFIAITSRHLSTNFKETESKKREVKNILGLKSGEREHILLIGKIKRSYIEMA